MKSKTVPYNIRLPRALLAKARTLADIPEIVRNQLQLLVNTRVCPCCGQEIETKKSTKSK